MQHTTTHFSRAPLAALACSSLSLLASAQVDPAPVLSLDQAVYEPGQVIGLTYQGTPGDMALLLVNSSPDEVFIPGLGTLGLSLGAGLMVADVGIIPPTGELALSCSVDCESPLLEVPCYLQGVSVFPQQLAFRPPSNVQVLAFAGGDCGVCVEEAINDPALKNTPSVHALWLPGVAKDFAFTAGGDFVERADGTARLTGVLSSLADEDLRFEVDVLFSGRVNPGEALYPPLDSPKLELVGSAYVDGGGAIDPRNWHYYEQTDGLLIGRGDLDGGVLHITRKGPAFQVGFGANGKNGNYGASGWLMVQVLTEPDAQPFGLDGKGDFNLDLSRECVDCATAAEDHALTMQGIAKDMVFVEGGEFVERADGTASLRGVVEDVNAPDLRWLVDVSFTGRVNPGAVAHPPVDSPKLELPDGAYEENGGDVDPTAWHYYLTTDGTLTGLGANDGAQIQLMRKGPAFQVGQGASGKNTLFGASGWLDYQVLQQPLSGAHYPDSGKGDFNLDLSTECPPSGDDSSNP